MADEIINTRLTAISNCTFIVEDLQERPQGYAVGPERALMAALLFDGVQAYLNFMQGVTKMAKTRYREAFSWVHSRGDEYIFSFENVCQALGIEPDALRYGLANIATVQQGKLRKSRRS